MENVNMTMEEVIKYETEKRFNDLKIRAQAQGLIVGEKEELYFKTGVAYGISIAGLALVNVDSQKLLKQGE